MRVATLISWTLTLAVLASSPTGARELQEESYIDDVLADEIVFASSLGEVRFDHRFHAEELGVACGACHHDTLAEDLDTPHPEYLVDFWLDCSICHRSAEDAGRPQACSVCHDGSPVSIADQTLSSKVVIHRSCWGCHEVGTGVEASGACSTCHQQPETEAAP
jgi:hypothetical protein